MTTCKHCGGEIELWNELYGYIHKNYRAGRAGWHAAEPSPETAVDTQEAAKMGADWLEFNGSEEYSAGALQNKDLAEINSAIAAAEKLTMPSETGGKQ